MVCGNDCKASVVGSSPQGAMPNSMKEKHILVIAVLREEGTWGDKYQGILVFQWASNLMGSAISNELPSFREAICMKGELGNVMMFQVKSARPRHEVWLYLLHFLFLFFFLGGGFCVSINCEMTRLIRDSCLWIRVVSIFSVIENDMKRLKNEEAAHFGCHGRHTISVKAMFNLLHERGHAHGEASTTSIHP